MIAPTILQKKTDIIYNALILNGVYLCGLKTDDYFFSYILSDYSRALNNFAYKSREK